MARGFGWLLICVIVGCASPAIAQNDPRTYAYVSVNSLNVREGAGAEFPVVGRLALGDQVTILGDETGWARVTARDVAGWVTSQYLSQTKPPSPPSLLTEARIRILLVQENLSNYFGSCPCPESVDRAGRRCGARSAYSRPGGAEPFCYPNNVPDHAVRAYRNRVEE